MRLYEPSAHQDAIKQHLTNNKRLVCCLCAEWCDNCEEWKTHFSTLTKSYPDFCFVWVDIDEHPDLVTEVDLSTLPVLLVQDRDDVLFLGTIRPSVEWVSRFISLKEPAMAIDDPFIYEFLVD